MLPTELVSIPTATLVLSEPPAANWLTDPDDVASPAFEVMLTLSDSEKASAVAVFWMVRSCEAVSPT